MTVTALVTCAGSMPAVGVINALKGQGQVPLRVLGADMNRLSAGLYLADAGFPVPGIADPGYVPAVLDLCRREGVDVLFPILDEELPLFAGAEPEFRRAGVRVITCPPDVVARAGDKYQTYQFCRRHGILVPPTYLPGELAAAEPLTFPLIVKPRRGRGTRDVFPVRDRRELDFFSAYVPDALVQGLVRGREYTLDILTDFGGEVLSVVPKARLETKAGMQVKGRTVKDGRLIEYGRDVARRFGLAPRGNVQCIVADDGIYLIEVNPKFPASLPFTVAAGVNAPLLLVRMHLGEEVPPLPGQFREGLQMVRYWQEIFVGPDGRPASA